MKWLIGLCALALSGCVTSQSLKDGLYQTSSCGLTTSISCATQAIGGCISPALGASSDRWKTYAVCLWDKAKSCSKAGLSRCALSGAVVAGGFPGLGSPPSGSDLVMLSASSAGSGAKCDDQQIRSCVTDARIENRKEAVQVVSYCYRYLCNYEIGNGQ